MFGLVCGFGVLVSLCCAGVQFLALRRSRAAALPVRCNAGVFKVRLIMFLLTFRTVVLWRRVSPSVASTTLTNSWPFKKEEAAKLLQ